jgi:hypothetical protein
MEYDNRLLGFNEWRMFLRDGESLEGRIRGVNSIGQLLLETRPGELLALNHGEIEITV